MYTYIIIYVYLYNYICTYNLGVYAGAGLGTAALPSRTHSTATSHSDTSSLSSSSDATNLQIPEIKSQPDWSKYCAQTYRGICAIAVVPSTPSSTTTNDNNNNNTNPDVSTFNSIANTMLIKAKSSAAPFNFMIINGYCHTEFLEAFDIQRMDLPVIIAYSVAKNKFALFRNSFTEVSR
jgi:hypothetical protein